MQGRSQDSVNGGAQQGAVTRAYNRQIISVKGVFPAEVLSGPLAHVRSSPPRKVWGYAPPENIGILDFLRWSLMHLLNKKSLPMPNQNNVEQFLSYCKRKLS